MGLLANYFLATASLLFGLFFLAYALKYYASVGLILFGGNSHNNGMNDAHANGYGEDLDHETLFSTPLPL